MRFLLEVQELQKKEQNRKRIVIVRCGAFFVGIGKDAVILHNLFNLKTVCISLGICKVGIPVNSIAQYIEKLENKKYSFVINDYVKDEHKYTELYNYKGKEIIQECNCYDCSECDYYKKNNFNVNIYQIMQNIKKQKKEKVKMNYCYVIARIISDIDYKFMMEKKKYAKAVMQIELTSKSIIKAVAYNLTADYVLRNLKQGMEIAIEGELHNNEIEIKSIEISIKYIL